MLAVGLMVVGVASLVGVWLRPRVTGERSLTGVWQQVGGGETMAFSGEGDLKIDNSVGRYRFIDGSHIEIRVPNGSQRFAFYSPKTGNITWTNGRGVVLDYEFRRGLSLQNRVRGADGL